MSERSRVAALALFIAALAGGCTVTKVIGMVSTALKGGDHGEWYSVPGYLLPRRGAGVRAGVARRDITPPPGFPTGGHGPAGDVARGRWMPLYARAFFFQDHAGRTLTLVSAELFAMPGGLHAKVASLVTENLRARGLQVGFEPDALILAATHTHQSPGNFMTSRALNQFGSSYYGFSIELFEFLAWQISAAVIEAIDDAYRSEGAISLGIHKTSLDYGTLINRAPGPFMLNRDRDAILKLLNGADDPGGLCAEPVAGDGPAGGWDLEGCPRLKGVDRALTVLEVLRAPPDGAPQRIGALVFLAAHPTGLPDSTPFYSSDFAGVAMTLMERRDASATAAPVYGFFNGAEGDITLWRREGARDLAQVHASGADLVRSIDKALHDGTCAKAITDADSIEVKTRMIDTAEADQRECSVGALSGRLADRPVIGAALFGGGEDDRTPLYALGWRDGVRDRAIDDQGVKLPALDSRIVRGLAFTKLLGQPQVFPRIFPITLARLFDLRLAAVPAEMTTAAGVLLRRALAPGPAEPIARHGELEIIGLANEYHSYVTSTDEYWEQDYIGASTIWGPLEAPFIACSFAALAAQPPPPTPGPFEVRHGKPRCFDPGIEPIEPFGPSFIHDIPRPTDGLGRWLHDEDDLPNLALPWVEWTEEVSPSLAGAFDALRLAPPRSISIVTFSPTGARIPYRAASRLAPDDDRSDAILTIYLGRGRWGAIWVWAPDPRSASPQEFAFVVQTGGKQRCSKRFSPAVLAPVPGPPPSSSPLPSHELFDCDRL